ncbi:MAG: prepilin-type N-terminal cleavage/methylation domain-containing protein [Verrucomicrobia bacterium]|nr:prepilin-type N-terminal cleavage/methylation domain-containing protein [Verrucomicrobiota bacterium]
MKPHSEVQVSQAAWSPKAGSSGGSAARFRHPVFLRAFTLMELMVVIGIIAIVLAIALPNLRGSRESLEIDAASRQLIADISLARGLAINGRTTVAMIFLPSDILLLDPASFPPPAADQLKLLQAGVYSQYALFSFRRTGDQPGRSTARYLTEWKSLPAKTFIAEDKFIAFSDVNPVPQFDYAEFPFPFATNLSNSLPYVAFNYEGRLSKSDGSPLVTPADIRIPLARGAIFYSRDPNTGVVDLNSFIAQEVPKGNSATLSNHVVIDWISGRARLERGELR